MGSMDENFAKNPMNNAPGSGGSFKESFGKTASGTSFSSGNEPRPESKKVKNYNFKAPQKFTREDIKSIRDIFEGFSRLFSSYITGLTRVFCHAKVIDIVEQRYYEFSSSLDEFVIMGIINLGIEDKNVAETEIMMQFSNDVTTALIDRFMGGQCTPMEIKRDFTEIETALMKSLMEKSTSFLQDAWSGYIDVSPFLVRIDTNTSLSKSIAPEEIVVKTTLEIELDSFTSTINICIPAVNMEELISHFTRRIASKSKRKIDESVKEEQRSSILKGVKNTELTLHAVLAETTVELSDILSLQVNDIISLDVPITTNAKVKVNDVHWFNAKPGISGSRKAIKIIDICDRERKEDNNEQ